MDSLSEIIPLLVILGSIILSIVGGSKKKKPEATPNNQPGNPQPMTKLDLPDFVFPKESKVPEEEKVVVQPIKKKVSTVKATPKAAPKTNVPDAFPTETAEPLYSFDDLDEVKKGIIYSEILNRKEY